MPIASGTSSPWFRARRVSSTTIATPEHIPAKRYAGSLRLECSALRIGGQRSRELVQVALEDRVEAMLRELDAVVREPILGKVVRADLLRPLAAADLGAARGGLL